MIRIFNHRAALRAALAITGPALQSAPAVGPRDYQARACGRRLAVGSLAISSGCLTYAACKEVFYARYCPFTSVYRLCRNDRLSSFEEEMIARRAVTCDHRPVLAGGPRDHRPGLAGGPV